jgi:hypothetical protein
MLLPSLNIEATRLLSSIGRLFAIAFLIVDIVVIQE